MESCYPVSCNQAGQLTAGSGTGALRGCLPIPRQQRSATLRGNQRQPQAPGGSSPGSTNPRGADVDGGDRKLCGQACPAAVWAIEPKPAAERLDTVLEPDQTSAAADRRAPGAVVGDRDE